MSDSPIPVYVDTRKVFLQQAEIEGTVPLERLARFRESLATDVAGVQVKLHFSTNQSKQQLITGELAAQVEVTCQRCLEPLAITLADRINLALLSDETQVARLDPELDPWICHATKLDLASLVEEQLMLCMPIVNYHPGENCLNRLGYKLTAAGKDGSGAATGAVNPFAALKALKK